MRVLPELQDSRAFSVSVKAKGHDHLVSVSVKLPRELQASPADVALAIDAAVAEAMRVEKVEVERMKEEERISNERRETRRAVLRARRERKALVADGPLGDMASDHSHSLHHLQYDEDKLWAGISRRRKGAACKGGTTSSGRKHGGRRGKHEMCATATKCHMVTSDRAPRPRAKVHRWGSRSARAMYQYAWM